MLASTHRLRRSREFTDAVRAGRRAGRATLVVHLREPAGQHESPPPGSATTTLPPARVGFVVSRAVGNAVVRNRVRRRLRHLVAGHLDQLPPGATVVVRALPAAATASHRRLSEDLTRALAAVRRTGVIS